MRVLPLLGRQDRLALKGGTAINLFVQDLPRLSVDIDLAYTGLEGRDEALAQIHAALQALRAALEALGLAVQGTPLRGTRTWVKLVVHDGAAQVKVEVSPVLRGTVYAPMPRQTTPAVQAAFGFVEVPVLALPWPDPKAWTLSSRDSIQERAYTVVFPFSPGGRDDGRMCGVLPAHGDGRPATGLPGPLIRCSVAQRRMRPPSVVKRAPGLQNHLSMQHRVEHFQIQAFLPES